MSADLADVPAELRPAVAAALSAAGMDDGHLAVELVDEERIRKLNREHRGRDAATDVLSFPLDGADATPGPRELGDVVICPPLCADVTEAAVHGTLHLCGFDHETDDGQMLELQEQVMAQIAPPLPRSRSASPPESGSSASPRSHFRERRGSTRADS